MDRTPLYQAPRERGDRRARPRQRLIQYLAIGISVVIVGSVLGHGFAASSGMLEDNQTAASEAERRDRVVASLRAALGLPQPRRGAEPATAEAPDPAAVASTADGTADGSTDDAPAPPATAAAPDTTPAFAAIQPGLAAHPVAPPPPAESSFPAPDAAPAPPEPAASTAPEIPPAEPAVAEATAHREQAEQDGGERSTAARLLPSSPAKPSDPGPARAERPQRAVIEARIAERRAELEARKEAAEERTEQRADRHTDRAGERDDDKQADSPREAEPHPAPSLARVNALANAQDSARPRRGDGPTDQRGDDHKGDNKGGKERGGRKRD